MTASLLDIILYVCIITTTTAHQRVPSFTVDQPSGSGSGSQPSSYELVGSRTGSKVATHGHSAQTDGNHMKEKKQSPTIRQDGGSWPETETEPEEPGPPPPTGNGNEPVTNPPTPTEETGSGNEPETYPPPPTGSAPQPSNSPYPAPSGGTGSSVQSITYPPMKVTGNGTQPMTAPPVQSRPQAFVLCKAPCTQYSVAIRVEREKTVLSAYKFTRLQIRPMTPVDVTDLLGGQKTFLTPGMFNPSVLQSPTTVVQYLSPLVQIAYNLVPRDYIATTPLFFYIPSYLRSIDAERASLVTREAIHYLEDKHQVPFLFTKMGFATKQSASSWVTLNFLRGALRKPEDTSDYSMLLKSHSKKPRTVGILNINADLRVVMSFNKIIVDSNVTDLIRASDNVFALVADESPADLPNMLLNYVMALNNGSNDEIIVSPCHHKSFEKRIRLQLIPKLLLGSGNKKRCREVLKEVIPHFMARHIQRYKGRLYTFSATVESLQEAGCSSCDANMKYITPGLIVKTAQEFCESSYDNVYACLQSSILIEGLTHRYRIRDNKRIRVLQNVSGIELEWSLGAILISLGLLESEV